MAKTKSEKPTQDEKVEKVEKKTTVEKKTGGRVERPDETYYKAKLDEIEKKINKSQDEKKKVQEGLDAKQTGKESFQSDRADLIAKVEKTKAQRVKLQERKKQLIDESKAKKAELREKKKQSEKLNEEAIDREIHTLEMKLQLGTMSLNEEKMTMLKIKKLKTIEKPQAQRHARELEKLQAGDSAVPGLDPNKTVDQQLDDLKEQIDALVSQQTLEQELLNDLKKARATQTDGVEKLLEDRKGLNENIKSLLAEKQAIRTARDADYTAWKEWMAKERKMREEKEKAEWAAWEAAGEAEKAQRDLDKPNPFLNQTMLLEQVIDYCKGILGMNKKAEAVAEKELDMSAVPADVTVLQGKRQQEGFASELIKGKKLKQKGNKVKSSAIKHTADTLKFFEEVKMKAPLNTSEVPQLLETLEGQLAEVNAKVKVWESSRQDKLTAAKALEAEAAAKTPEE